MIIPIDSIAVETLQNLLEDIVTRDGTDYGKNEISVDTKVEQIRSVLQAGDGYIVFDEKTETCSFMTKETACICCV